MSKYTEKSKEYTMNYMKEKLDEIKFRVPKVTKATIRLLLKMPDCPLVNSLFPLWMTG